MNMTRSQSVVAIILSEEASAVEQYAAAELKKYLLLVYGVDAVIDRVPCWEGPSIILGNVWQHPGVSEMIGPQPELSADGFCIRTVHTDPPALAIAGGAGRGTLFGVYEWIERWGVQFLLSGDVLPETPAPFCLTGYDEKCEPAYPFRGVRPMANLPEGAAAWSLAEFTGFIDQMAKLKFNTFVFVIMESGPWLDYEYRGLERPAGDIFYGFRFPVGEGFVGKELFDGRTEYYSPVLGAARNDTERKLFGIELVRAIIRHCKERNLLSLLTFSFLEPPTAFKHAFNEWASLPLPDPKSFEGAFFSSTPAEEFGLNPKYGAWMNVLDPVVRELTAHRVKALIDTYPEADFYHLWVSEHRSGPVDSDAIFAELDRKYCFASDFDFERESHLPGLYPFPERFRHHMKGDLLFLHAFDKIFNDGGVMKSTIKPDASLGLAGIMSKLAPVAAKIMPKGTASVQFLDYGTHGPADQIESLIPQLEEGMPTILEIGVNDDNDMYFPQGNVESLERIVATTAKRGMQGYVMALWQVRQSDINAAYLARASWRPGTTASDFYRDIAPKLVGRSAAAGFENGYRSLEVADRHVRKSSLYGMAFPMTDRLIGGLIQMGVGDQMNLKDISEGRALFERAFDWFDKARASVISDRSNYINFWWTRTRLAIDWLDMMVTCGRLGAVLGEGVASGVPLDAKQKQLALTMLDALSDQIEGMIRMIARDASHQGDLGQVANMNWHVLKPIRELHKDIALRSDSLSLTLADTRPGQRQVVRFSKMQGRGGSRRLVFPVYGIRSGREFSIDINQKTVPPEQFRVEERSFGRNKSGGLPGMSQQFNDLATSGPDRHLQFEIDLADSIELQDTNELGITLLK